MVDPLNQSSENNNPPSTSAEGGSLLQSILSTPSSEPTSASAVSSDAAPSSAGGTPPPSPKKPVSPKDFLKFVGVALIVGLIVFGAFLGYVISNPDQAYFFVDIGVNPNNLKDFLASLIKIVFGSITAIISIVWIVFLFKAFLTKKEFKKQKTINIILAIFFTVLLFSEVSLWVYMFNVFKGTVYSSGSVVFLDADMVNSKQFATRASIDVSSIIGPEKIRFDLKENAQKMAANIRSRGLKITGYKVDFDGDGSFDKKGSDPMNDITISCTYGAIPTSGGIDKKDCVVREGTNYTPKVVYETQDTVKGTAGVDIEVQDIPEFKVLGSVVVKEVPQATGGKRVLFDASGLSNIGTVEWYSIGSKDELKLEMSDYRYSPDKIISEEAYYCMKLTTGGSALSDCSRLFVITKSGNGVEGKISYTQDIDNPLALSFKIDDLKSKTGIASYLWIVNETDKQESDVPTLDYRFLDYGKQHVAVQMKDYVGNTYSLDLSFILSRPLKLVRYIKDNVFMANSLLRVLDANGKTILDNTYDSNEGIYIVPDFSIPQSGITFNAQSVRATDPKYELTNVEWDLDGDGKFEKTGKVITGVNFLDEKKYTITARYTFASNLRNDSQTLSETIVFDTKRKEIVPRLQITPESDYAPTTVKFDASASEVRAGKIAKYTYDFGEGKGETDKDAQAEYSYKLGGEYTIKLIVTKDDGTKETIVRKLVLKDGSTSIKIRSSVSSSYVGKTISFDAVGSTGQITDYYWDFGDGQTSIQPNPEHSFNTAGTYTVSLKLTYSDGTTKDTNMEMVIQNEASQGQSSTQ